MSTINPPPPPTYILREHRATVNHVCLFDSDTYLASCDANGWIVIWRLSTRRVILQWKAHKDNCLKVVAVSNDTLVSQGRDSMVYIWKLSLDEGNMKAEEIKSIVYNDIGFCKVSCLFDEEHKLLCLASMEGVEFFGIFDVTHYEWIVRAGGEKRFGACMAVKLYKTESLFVLAGYENGGTVLWEIKQGKSRLIWKRREHKEPILDLCIDTTRSYLISSSADNQICQQKLVTGDVIKKITIKKSGTPTINIRHDNKIFATGGYDGRLRIFSTKRLKPLAILELHRNTVYSLDFGTQSNWLVGASQDNRISLWNIF